MVNQHAPPLDQFDLFKRKHLRQNRDIIRANSTQAIRIKTLETDVRRLLDENLGLRTELIQVKCQLARQSQSSNLIESTRSAQHALEKVLLDVAGIKNGLEDSLQVAREGQSIDMSNVSARSTKKPVKERRRMDLKFVEFNEERKNKQKALSSGLEAPFVGSPRVMSETDASDSESEDIITEDIAVSESSKVPLPPPPRSRRDSLIMPTVKRTNLKNPGREKTPIESSPPPSAAKDNPRKRRRSDLFATSGKENFSAIPPSASDLFSPQRTNEKAQRGVLAESSPPRPSLLIPAGLTRLESPNKPLNTFNVQDKSTRLSDSAVVSHLKDMFEIMGDFEEGTGGRRVSRARKQVNYALPNLRDKMRREDNPEEKGRGRSLSVDRSVTPDQTMTELPPKSLLKESVTIKPEILVKQDVPRVTSTSQPAAKNVIKPRLSLVERQSLANASRPTSDSTSRKRRTSSIHKPLPTSSQPSLDIFRFPSESPPKQPPPKTKPVQQIPPKPAQTEDKENSLPVFEARERRKTFNVTMEKLAQMAREEMEADKDWEAHLANKRRRQSVAV